VYGLTLFSFSVLTAWPAPCANNPIFAEIVPPEKRNLIYSFDRCFEGAVAAFATPFVGIMSEHIFGFKGTSSVSGDPEIDIPNAKALAKALLTFLTVPWLFCFLVYSTIHFTYPKDKHRAFVSSKSSRRPIESEALLSSRHQELNGMNKKDTTMVHRPVSNIGSSSSNTELTPS